MLQYTQFQFSPSVSENFLIRARREKKTRERERDNMKECVCVRVQLPRLGCLSFHESFLLSERKREREIEREQGERKIKRTREESRAKRATKPLCGC